MASSRTLAEKYRPRNFDEVFGQSVPVRYLRSIVGRRPRSVIISGPYGSGKTTLARIYAKAALCERLTKTGNPCDECDYCTRFDSEVDCALTSGIEKIREIAEVLRLPPMWAKRRVVVLDEVQGLSHSAKRRALRERGRRH